MTFITFAKLEQTYLCRHKPFFKMKYKHLIFLLLTITTFSIKAQNLDAVEKSLTAAFKKGDARELAKHFSNTLSIELPSKSGSYSKDQAQMILRDFFKANKPEGFAINHKGENRDGSQFIIGILQQGTDQYRVYVIMKKQKEKLLIHHLNIARHEQ
jgi:hypothetical protein